MKIKKLSHCCLVIDVKDCRIVLDPGEFSIEEHRKVRKADIILITHEHYDHLHIESLKELVKNNAEVIVITNDAVGELLSKEGIKHRVMKHGNSIDVKDVHIDAYGEKHAQVHSSIPPVSNVGFFIENKFFFPGDAFTNPDKKVDVLALPVAGPWMKLGEAIDYGLLLKPRIAFPVHDAVRIPSQHKIPEKVLEENGIQFIKLEEGGELNIE
ncbi:MAG: MBL fold metallo-hydrolase [Patescibacteria group bacterium]